MAWCVLCFQSCHCTHLATNPNRAKAPVFPTSGWIIIKRCPEIIFSGRLIMELTIAHIGPKGHICCLHLKSQLLHLMTLRRGSIPVKNLDKLPEKDMCFFKLQFQVLHFTLLLCNATLEKCVVIEMRWTRKSVQCDVWIRKCFHNWLHQISFGTPGMSYG